MASPEQQSSPPERKRKSFLRRLLSYALVLFGVYVGVLTIVCLILHWTYCVSSPETRDGDEPLLQATKQGRATQAEVLAQVGQPTYRLENVSFEQLRALKNVARPPLWRAGPSGTVWIYDHFNLGWPNPWAYAAATAYVYFDSDGRVYEYEVSVH